MRYALISDVHANRPALEATLRHIDQTAPDATVLHLGDLVGYAPWADEVVELIRSRGIQGIAGNYDSTVAADYKHCGCKYEDPRQEELSHLSYEWTRSHVGMETRRFLGSLPFRLDLRPRGGHTNGPTLTLLHGNHVLNTFYMYEDRPDSMLEKMATAVGAKSGDVIAFGHTHKAWTRELSGVYFVNTGSVGRPKDGDPRAGYVMLDLSGARPAIAVVRVAYDVEAAAAGILASSLPHEFADFLRTGGKSATAPQRAGA